MPNLAINAIKALDQFASFRLYKKRVKKSYNELNIKINNLGKIKPHDIISIAPVFNEKFRIKRYIEHNISIGIDHQIFIDNNSSDELYDVLNEYGCISCFHTTESYAKARSGTNWINSILHTFAKGHWCLFADVDELYIYPYYTSRTLHEYVDYFDSVHQPSIFSTMVDVYYSLENNTDFYFDPYGYFYFYTKNKPYVKGGPRLRLFNASTPNLCPTMRKMSLIRFNKNTYFYSSAHQILPNNYNEYHKGSILPTSVLLHVKFDESFQEKVAEATARKEHWGGATEYITYEKNMDNQLYTAMSQKVEGWECFIEAGLMSKGLWY